MGTKTTSPTAEASDAALSVSGEDERSSSCVLIVDDEEDIRETLREAVEMIGCTVITAANGFDALKMLTKHRPCLIVLDLLMPVMTGQEMIAAMRSEPKLAKLPVLVSTSAPQHAPPGVPVLPKPINIQVLWTWLRQSCACDNAGATAAPA